MKKFTKYSFDNVWRIAFSGGEAEGEFTHSDQEACLTGENFVLKTTITEKFGVSVRRDSFTNTSNKSIHITALRSRFLLQRSEYEFYTQYNAWQAESQGKWVTSPTGVIAYSNSTRTTMGAAPFLGIWNNQTSRGWAFHLIPDGSWRIDASYISLGGKNGWLLIDMGIDADNLCLCVNPGETFHLPEIWYYEIKDKLSMDSYKLHRYSLDRYPRKQMPVVYNTWLYKFDRFDFDNIIKQVPVAAKLGCEYFTIDAGWFGHGPHWVKQIGDWNENMISGFIGKTIDIANEVRKCGMKFGLWVEPTRAVEGSVAAAKHSEYFLKSGKNYFLDFANPDAVRYITDIIDNLIEKYGIEYFKFDNNADLNFDLHKSGFTEYYKGYNAFIKRMREKYPHIYFQGCASGGQMLDLSMLRNYDSLWPTDNQGVYFGTRLLKDTIRRMPSQMIDRWAVITSMKNLSTYTADDTEHIISTGDATCDYVEGVQLSYLKGFLSGGPLGFSCDLTALSEETFESLKEHIEAFKKERSFFMTAECRVLADTKTLTALQYSYNNLAKSVIQVFTSDLGQEGLYVYPVLNNGKIYVLDNGEKMSAEEILENGLYIPLTGSYHMNRVTLIEE